MVSYHNFKHSWHYRIDGGRRFVHPSQAWQAQPRSVQVGQRAQRIQFLENDKKRQKYNQLKKV